MSDEWRVSPCRPLLKNALLCLLVSLSVHTYGDPFSQSYRCVQNAPLDCDRPLKTAQEVPNAKFCLECGFPATLADKAEIHGDQGVYRVVGFVRSQGMGRLYKGIQVSDSKLVVINPL